MSDKNIEAPAVREEEAELSDETLEQVAGGCQWGDSGPGNTVNTLGTINTLQQTEPLLIS